MKIQRGHHQRGFTLIELALAMGLGITVGAMLLAVVNQQVSFLTIYRAQGFLIDEAPMMNMYFSRVMAKADQVELKYLKDNGLTEDPNSGSKDANALLMHFRQPDGTWTSSVLGYNEETLELAYFTTTDTGNNPVWTKQWTVAKLTSGENVGVVFEIEDGVVEMALTGPAGEEISYYSYPSYSGDISE
ncbi:hypothetical protein JIN85_00405 [Luteolibacter pohnpeiensis]|uniref:Prepilin-type N-terminal cleavage/methylation domain-containing protein n=1 Tax=Luteolibacter pohnpeiensis TaxID=454153 RepID=A0A934VU82_9BACT|nr:hypothetical protein [Luteolibacter pohnpeiensis]MBK1880850.1 hypothetical protein [Luteolibacter pohnpeiensis]